MMILMRNDMQQKVEQQSRSRFIIVTIVAGVVGTVAFNMVMYLDVAATGVPLDLTRVLGSFVVGREGPVDAAGNIFHFAIGIGLALFYVYVFLPISKRVTKRSMWFYGIIYAVMVAVGPIFFGLFPALGAGIAGIDISPLVAPMTIMRHIAFGAALGILVRRLRWHS
jgi:Na+-transporting NADH:ubiquinone oxidoreductase subunit NqrB